MAVTNTHHIKTDKRDAANIARCLAFHTYSEVYVPDNDDNDVKEYIRMRDDQKLYLKMVKQQILAFVLRQGKCFEGGKTYWTIAHLKWLKNLELSALQRETLDEYLLTYEYLTEKINRFDERIEELASAKRYEEKVKHMGCLLGIKTHTALSMIVEVGDFERFDTIKSGQRYFVSRGVKKPKIITYMMDDSEKEVLFDSLGDNTYLKSVVGPEFVVTYRHFNT